MKNKVTIILLGSALLLASCRSDGSVIVGSQDDLTDFVESGESGYVYVHSDESEEQDIVTHLAEENGVEVLIYNIYKPDGENKIPSKEQPNYKYLGEITKNAISYMEKGEVVKELKVDVNKPDFNKKFKVFMKSTK